MHQYTMVIFLAGEKFGGSVVVGYCNGYGLAQVDVVVCQEVREMMSP